jgi:hypothetical protein
VAGERGQRVVAPAAEREGVAGGIGARECGFGMAADEFGGGEGLVAERELLHRAGDAADDRQLVGSGKGDAQLVGRRPGRGADGGGVDAVEDQGVVAALVYDGFDQVVFEVGDGIAAADEVAVVAQTAVEIVGAGAAGEDIVAGQRPDEVVAGAAVDAVGDAGAFDAVIAVGAVEVETLGQHFFPGEAAAVGELEGLDAGVR